MNRLNLPNLKPNLIFFLSVLLASWTCFLNRQEAPAGIKSLFSKQGEVAPQSVSESEIFRDRVSASPPPPSPPLGVPGGRSPGAGPAQELQCLPVCLSGSVLLQDPGQLAVRRPRGHGAGRQTRANHAREECVHSFIVRCFHLTEYKVSESTALLATVTYVRTWSLHCRQHLTPVYGVLHRFL